MKKLNAYTKWIFFIVIIVMIFLYADDLLYLFSRVNSINVLGTSSPIKIYVAPSGNDSNSGTVDSPLRSVEVAKNKVRQLNANMNANIEVFLRGGEYSFDKTLIFTSDDSGRNGYRVIYKNFDGEAPIITGGIRLQNNWTKSGNMWKTNIGPGQVFRQLYVNGVRAIRARSDVKLDGQALTSVGFNTTDLRISRWLNLKDIELVGSNLWKEFRCPIESVVEGTITLQNPCFINSQLYKPFIFEKVDFIENALELVDKEREWYYDRNSGWLYYYPTLAENMTSVRVVIPKLEQLILGQGTESRPIENITFSGITFAFNSWSKPSSNTGLVEIQGNQLYVSQNKTGKPTSAVTFVYGHNLEFLQNTFTHLGSAGLDLGNGSQNVVIDKNQFFDISSNALMLGDVDNPNTTNNSLITKNNKITNNLIYDIGKEYHGAVGMFIGYTQNSVVQNNTLYNLPYTGISIGWGWGGNDPTVAKNNLIENNLIFNHVNYLADGGGIYSLSAQPGNIYRNNVILNQANEYGGLYLDNGSRYIRVEQNVLFNNKRSLLLHGGGENLLVNNYWQNRYEGDLWDDQNPKLGLSTFENNKTINSLIEAPIEVLRKVGTPPIFTSPASDIVPGKTKIAWKEQNFASTYLLRVDDLEDPMVCSNEPKNNDICIEIKNPIYEYDFKPNHTYKIWVHSTNTVTNTYGPASYLDLKVGDGENPTLVQGDYDGSGHVDMLDYNLLKSNYGKPYTLLDFNLLISNFGK